MQKPRFSMSIRRMMIAVAFIGIVMRVGWWMVFGSTDFSPGYDEGRFRQIRVGMTSEEVEALMGPPLKKVPWPPQDWPYQQGVVNWSYTDSRPGYSNYWLREVLMKDGKVSRVMNMYWVD